jgi:Na+-transporting methylmalonyl-CoA/oxaloacetate decarboxylase gamma subunit
MSQRAVARSIWLTVVMMAVSFILLVATVAAFIAHAPRAGDVFLVLMLLSALVAFGSSVRSRSRSRAFVREARRAAR